MAANWQPFLFEESSYNLVGAFNVKQFIKDISKLATNKKHPPMADALVEYMLLRLRIS